ncbi:MAG: FkbM family methyltransferase [Bacteroidia bacterium]|nr:FkbM family methyltransferase [Bacteroidia bacterium]
MWLDAVLIRLGLLRSVAMYYWKPFNRRRLMRFYSQFVRPGSLCFDIGSHLGNRIWAWRALGARVVALEPQPQCLAFLQRRFGQDPEVALLGQAAGAKPGILPLHISRLTPTISTLSDSSWRRVMRDATSFRVSWDYSVQVEVVTLDKLIARFGVPDFCKIDVEDFEVQVLNGLTRPLPALSFEYFTPTLYRAQECIARLESLGDYEYNWSFGESQQMQSAGWLEAEAMLEVLSGYTPSDPSGDIYARLKPA